jgi:hypothetical protein
MKPELTILTFMMLDFENEDSQLRLQSSSDSDEVGYVAQFRQVQQRQPRIVSYIR